MPVTTEIVTKPEERIKITIPLEVTTGYEVDENIASGLGFNADIAMINFTTGNCSNLSFKQTDSKSISRRDKYDECLASRYSLDDEYLKCTGSGECSDMHRWEHIGINSCPIDSDINLDYPDTRLQDDFEYFGEDNRSYCKRIVDRIRQYGKRRITNPNWIHAVKL